MTGTSDSVADRRQGCRKVADLIRRGTPRSYFLQFLNFALWIVIIPAAAFGGPLDTRREKITKIVSQIQRADYEGDRSTLRRLYNELTLFADDKKLGAKVRYWRGFAMWRRALNGSNVSASPTELADDLIQAITEFEAAIKRDSAFVDAIASAGATRGLLVALYRANPKLSIDSGEEFVNKAISYIEEARRLDPENPRVLWMAGPVSRYLAIRRGENPEQAMGEAMKTYQKGLEVARSRKSKASDDLMPSWGEPELLMSLAASNLYRPTPDLSAAELYAREALALVPYWHFVKNILVPSIETAKTKAEIIVLERNALDRWGKGDPHGYLEIMSPEVTYFDPFREKRVDGLQALKGLLAPLSGNFQVEGYELLNPQVQLDGEIAVLTFNLVNTVNQANSEEKSTIRWNCTEIYKRIKGSWKIIHSHWSYTKPEK